MADCLVLTTLAEEFVGEIQRLADGDIDVVGCKSPEEALHAYSGEKVLFGNPAQIADVLPKMPDIDWIQSSWAGVTPLIENERRDYTLTGVKGVFGPQMSEYVFGYLLASELRILRRKHEQKKRHWFHEHSGVLDGKTIGVMGTGSIGAHIAGTAKAFNMTTIGLSRSGAPAERFDEVYPASDLVAFLSRSNYLVSTLPDTPETNNLLNDATLAALPEHAYFVNVGRANVVDDEALMKALRTGHLSGAALDVFDSEPLADDSPLWSTPNLSVTAHIAAISHPLLIVPIFIDNFRRYEKNQPLNYVIDFKAGY